MPRNIESLVEKYTQENDFEKFVLTFAIQTGIVVPNKILKQFGIQFGVDHFFHTGEDLDTIKKARAEFNVLVKTPEPYRSELLQPEIDKIHVLNLFKYNRDKIFYEDKMKNTNTLKEKVNLLKTSNNLQAELKSKMLKYIHGEIIKCEQFCSKRLIIPVKLDSRTFIRKERHKLNRRFKAIENELVRDPIFNEEIEREWFA